MINIAKNKKNASAVGILGKIRSVVEDFFLNEEALLTYAISSGSFNAAAGRMDYSSCWSLAQYKENVILLCETSLRKWYKKHHTERKNRHSLPHSHIVNVSFSLCSVRSRRSVGG